MFYQPSQLGTPVSVFLKIYYFQKFVSGFLHLTPCCVFHSCPSWFIYPDTSRWTCGFFFFFSSKFSDFNSGLLASWDISVHTVGPAFGGYIPQSGVVELAPLEGQCHPASHVCFPVTCPQCTHVHMPWICPSSSPGTPQWATGPCQVLLISFDLQRSKAKQSKTKTAHEDGSQVGDTTPA